MKIVSITAIDKKKSKIFTDQGDTFPLYQGEIRRYHLEEGGELSEQVLCGIYEEVLKKRVKERAMYLLKSMDKTENEIRTKLRQGGYPEQLVDYAVDFLKKYGYVDDWRYAQNYIRSYTGRKSRKMMVQSLLAKGLQKELIDEVLEEQDGSEGQDERGIIYELIKKKRYAYDGADWKEKNRVAGFLLRKGFQMEDVMYCLKNPPESEQ